jgi:hypothetical protein
MHDSVTTMLRTAFAIDPVRIAVDVVFFFPNWQPDLEFIDNVSAGLERLIAVRRRNADPNRHITDFEQACSVHATRFEKWKSLQRLSKHPVALRDDERLVGLVFQALHRPSVVFVPDPAFKDTKTACARIRQCRLEFLGVYCPVDNLDHLSRQQPVETAALCHHR